MVYTKCKEEMFDFFDACSPALNFILSQCLHSSNDSVTRECGTSLNLFCVDICMHGLHWLMENGVEVSVDKEQRAGRGV